MKQQQTAWRWPRLDVLEAPERPDAEKLRDLATALESDRKLRRWKRRRAAAYLRQLLKNESAMGALFGAPRGRPRSSRAAYLALDYLVCRELAGAGKGKVALHDVASAHACAATTVKKAFTAHGAGAKRRLARLIDYREGTSHRTGGGVWTRAELLAAVRDDLRDLRKVERMRAAKIAGFISTR